MPLTPEEKAARARARMIEKARERAPDKYARNYVAPVFQKMIRAEAAVGIHWELAVVNGDANFIEVPNGYCVCVTCGKVAPWRGNQVGGGGEIETGHFIASRRNSILFEETNAHPQCKSCNRHLHGNQGCYEMWMREFYGQSEIDRLRKMKTKSVSFSHEELVDMRIAYAARLKAAEERMLHA